MARSARRRAKQAGSLAAPAQVASRVASSKTSAGESGCQDSFGDQVLEEIVSATYWFDPGEGGQPYAALIRFTGRRVGPTGKPQPRDRFDQVEVVGKVVPGSGPISVTTRVHGINPGEWIVSAEPIVRNGQGRYVKPYVGPSKDAGGGAPWAWRKPAKPPDSAPKVKSRLAAFVKLPGTFAGAWWGLVGPGVIIGLILQSLLVARAHLDVRATLTISLVASLAGLVGSKLWFVALNRSFRGLITEGLCIQGFVAGVVVTAAIALPLAHIPVGTFLDASAPGLFLGMALGRWGCFFTGCCAGRVTSSRWGIWSSDRRVGARRIPTQLLESLLCLAIGSVALILVLLSVPGVSDAVFLGALSAYVLGRQFLLQFRLEPRKSSVGPRLTMSAAALVLASVILVATVGCLNLRLPPNVVLC